MFSPIKFQYVKLHLSVLPLVIFAFLFDFAGHLFFIYTIVLLHELAHALSAVLLGVKVDKIEILPFGISIQFVGSYIKTPMHEAIIAAAGPICSGVLAYIAHYFALGDFAVYANLSIAALNLVPALPLDGGRIVKAILTERWGYVKAFNFTIRLTRILALLLCVAGFVLVLYTGFNFSLLLVGAFLMVNTIQEQRGSTHIMMHEILCSREKLSGGSAERAGSIAISYREPARRALKLLSYNKYYFISVVGENQEILATVTETQLIEQLTKKGIRMKAAQLVP